MITSVTFDGESLTTTSQVITVLDHEGSPDREIDSYQIPREDGEVITSLRFSPKEIAITGVTVGSDADDVEGKMDDLKELLSRAQSNLVVSDVDGANRTYVATMRRLDVQREGMAPNVRRWTATMRIPDGVGYGPADQQVVAEFTSSYEYEPTAKTVSLTGTKDIKPVITVRVDNALGGATPWTAKGFSIENSDTGEEIAVMFAGSWDIDDEVIIDCENRKVTSNVANSSYPEVDFLGIFPRFQPGTNNLNIRIGCVPVQEIPVADPTDCSQGTTMQSTNTYVAQSFELQRPEDTVAAVLAIVSKTGSPGNLDVSIETDSDNSPSGVLAHANAEVTNVSMSITTTPAWRKALFASLATLEANTRYWLVFKPTGGTFDGSNYYTFWYPPGDIAPYKIGSAASTTDAGTTWTVEDGVSAADSDLAFRITAGGDDNAGPLDRIELTFDYDPPYL